ncbi:hypothetical protein F7725_020419 [Xyrichtys novacula]|uniref:Uncharacterized protein n=1 Tax=Xyrichtys novacula TaxID=13765 RepID=A0AAV1G0H8_XYRNO|nr:hypothetical protein F7725_020419 [Xyrichtys novacula]
MGVGEASNAFTQFVGDTIDLNIVSIHGNTPFHSMGWIKVTSPAPPLPDLQTSASHILDGGCFDKAIRAHLLIDAAIYQHIMKHAFTEEELVEMRTLMEKGVDGKMGARHTDLVVALFEQRFEEIFKKLAEGGRTHAIWVQYHHMVDVIKMFIRTERLADHDGHLSCIVTRMHCEVFAAAGHHQYAKGARLYCQLIKDLETLPVYRETSEHFTAHGNHVVGYSSHDWSGTWCDICIEQTLMKAAKSEGGLSRGRMRNSDSGHKCWVLTLSHFSNINQHMEEDVNQHAPRHRDLGKTKMRRDAEAVKLALQWFEENNPFNHNQDKEMLVSFSTGFTSTGDDPVNAERDAEGSYDVRRIREALSEKQRCYLVFLHAFTGFCAGDIDEHIEIFLDICAIKDAVIQAGSAIFHYIYNGSGPTLGAIRYNIFSRKAAAGLIKPETLPPTEGAAAQHLLRACLQTQDWLLLQSMSLDPKDYGWT